MSQALALADAFLIDWLHTHYPDDGTSLLWVTRADSERHRWSAAKMLKKDLFNMIIWVTFRLSK